MEKADIPADVLAYCAGLIDGEGCIHIHKKLTAPPSRPQQRSPYYRLGLRVKMAHKPTIEFLAETFGVGAVHPHQPGKLNKRVTWAWDVNQSDTITVLALVRPYLRVNADEADLAVDFARANRRSVGGRLRVPDAINAERYALYERMRTLKLGEWS
jgi:hypothetical protein